MYPKYPRPASPNGRRIVVPERSSTGTVGYSAYEPPYRSRHGSYTSPRSSNERVIPISEETYVDGKLSNKRTSGTYDAYTDYARRPYPDVTSPTRASANRARPAVVHNQVERPLSPRHRYEGDRDYYMYPASSAPRRNYNNRDYEVADRRGSKDFDDRDRDPKRTDDYGPQRDSKGYHLSGPIQRPRDVDDRGAWEYTDARGMYRDTEPRWRPRRTSADAMTSDRPTNLESLNKTGGRERPPPTTRGLEKLDPGLGRHSSLRDPVRSPQRQQRDRGFSYSEDDANMTVPPRRAAPRPASTYYDRDDARGTSEDYEDREPRRQSRQFEDTEVASRGFGIRTGSFDPPRVRDESYERRSGYVPSNRTATRDEYVPEPARSDRRRDADLNDREPVMEKGRELEKERDIIRDKEKDLPREKEREREVEDDSRVRNRDYPRERDRDARDFDDRRNNRDRYGDNDRYERKERNERKPDDDGQRTTSNFPFAAAATAAAGAASFGLAGVASDALKRRADDRSDISEDRDEVEPNERLERTTSRDIQPKDTLERADRAEDGEKKRERHYVRDDRDDQSAVAQTETIDPDEEYRQRMQRELDRAKQAKAQATPREPPAGEASRSEAPRSEVPRSEAPRSEAPRSDAPRYEAPRSEIPQDEQYETDLARLGEKTSTADRYKPRDDPLPPETRSEPKEKKSAADRYKPPEYLEAERRLAHSPVGSDVDIEDVRNVTRDTDDQSILGRAPPSDEPAQIIENRENRVRIVEPPKEKDMPKGILRRPTEKFPEDPNPIREGVAPLKDATKKGIPPGARWTKIDRRLVNPDALREAQERFEERQDCVIVLRVLTKEEIQKFADRTKELRDERYDHDHSHHRDRKHRPRDYDGTDESEGDDREERPKQKQIGWA